MLQANRALWVTGMTKTQWLRCKRQDTKSAFPDRIKKKCVKYIGFVCLTKKDVRICCNFLRLVEYLQFGSAYTNGAEKASI